MEIRKLWSDLRSNRVGFTIDETMTGEHEFVEGCGPAGKHPFSFHVTWGPRSFDSFRQFRDEGMMAVELRGIVNAGGLRDNAPCEGTLELRYFKDGKIRYDFTFEAERKTYHFVGEKVHIRPWNLPF